MAELSRFFDAKETIEVDSEGNQLVSYDRVYYARDFASYFSKFIKDGVFAQFADQLQVVAKEGLTVTVKTGAAWIEGYMYELTEDMDVTLSPNISSNPQIVKFVVVLLRQEREIVFQVVQGAETYNPVNDGTRHELVLATMSMAVGTATITDAMISDRRFQDAFCGIVTGAVQNVSTENLFKQYDSMFNTWFEKVKDQFASVEMGNVISQLDNLTDTTKKLQMSGFEFEDLSRYVNPNKSTGYKYYGTNESYYSGLYKSWMVDGQSYSVGPTMNNYNLADGEAFTPGLYLVHVIAGFSMSQVYCWPNKPFADPNSDGYNYGYFAQGTPTYKFEYGGARADKIKPIIGKCFVPAERPVEISTPMSFGGGTWDPNDGFFDYYDAKGEGYLLLEVLEDIKDFDISCAYGAFFPYSRKAATENWSAGSGTLSNYGVYFLTKSKIQNIYKITGGKI